MKYPFFSRLSFCKHALVVLFICIFQIQLVSALEHEQILKKIVQLENDFQDLSAEVYKVYGANTPPLKLLKNNRTIEQLHAKVNQAIKQEDQFLAMTLIYANIDIIEDNLNDEHILSFLKLLLEYNDYKTARHLKQEIENYSDQYFVSNSQLIFASYYSDRNEWENVSSLLNIELDELSSEDTNHAHLLKGMALQNQKKHREALKHYEKISKDSQHFPLSQLNTAIAYIRQDWWTDAHIILKQLLENSSVANNSDLANRLSLILGYSLLNKEYYREARESFRNIDLESQYTNRALMGISLAALNQKDTAGALNALSILNKKTPKELVVEESYLLKAHIYKNLEQYTTANSSYTIAINYYQNRIDSLIGESYSINQQKILEIIQKKQTDISLENTQLNFLDLYPGYFIKNFSEIRNFKDRIKSPELNNKVTQLYNDYNELFRAMLRQLIDRRITALKSYLSQAHFGIAQLYDKDDE